MSTWLLCPATAKTGDTLLYQNPWTDGALQEEFEAIMLPKHSRPSSGLLSAGKHVVQHKALTHAGSVPSIVSWVGTGGGGVVTDQAVCGSCWAFATAAALQGALWMKTGVRSVSLC